MSDAEGKILKIYDKSKPEDEDLYDTHYYLHWVWALVAALVVLAVWLSVALVNAENQRNALATNKCTDPLFKGEIDRRCLVTVSSRDHWWQHLWYGLTHLSPESPDKPVSRYKRR
jgi:hypothetical protein